LGDNSHWKKAANADGSYCFPSALEDYAVLQNAVRQNPKDGNAQYFTGCFLYDKKRYADARDCWEKAASLVPEFPTVWRNLALYYANKEKDYTKARELLEKAFSLDQTDSRVFYELCELYDKIGLQPTVQREVMEAHRGLVDSRDDLTVLYAQVLNSLHEHQAVIDLLMNRRFHPWEGGEGKVPAQHVEARIGLARTLMEQSRFQEAAEHLQKATVYFENFGEGKLTGAQENNIYYHLGMALRPIDKTRSDECFKKASSGLSEPVGAMYYNDQPPHMIFYQGLALLALGRPEEARSRFYKLISYGEKNFSKPQVMDYFAVSLPDFLVFESDLNDKNRLHCFYMMGLGYLGLGEKERAQEAFDKALAIAPNHYGVHCHRDMAL